MLCCTFIYFFILFHKTQNNYWTILKGLKAFFSIILVDVLNKDQVLIQIKGLEKVQQTESAQCRTHKRYVTLMGGAGRYTFVYIF